MVPVTRNRAFSTDAGRVAWLQIKPLIAAHHTSSKCIAHATPTEITTTNAAKLACAVRAPENSISANSRHTAKIALATVRYGLKRTSGCSTGSTYSRSSRKDNTAGVCTHEQTWRWLIQYQRHWKTSLQANPICGRRYIGQQLRGGRIPTDCSSDAGNPSTVEMPGMRVEPDPRRTANPQVPEVALLVVRDDPPRRSVH